MITKFKIYESVNKGEPEIGDYVIVFYEHQVEPNLDNFINTNIGKITKINDNEYSIFYEKIPKNINSYFNYFNLNNTRIYNKEHIKYWSKNKEDLDALFAAKIYNL